MKDASQKTDHFTAFRRWVILLLLPLQCRLLTLGEHTFFFFKFSLDPQALDMPKPVAAASVGRKLDIVLIEVTKLC